jgi:hypothetical protein
MDYNKYSKKTTQKKVLGWFSDLLLEAIRANVIRVNAQRAQYLHGLLIDQGRVLPGGKIA